MITRRLASAFVIALVISGIFTLWLSQKYSKAKPPAPPKNQYVAAVANLEAGQVIRAENLRMVDWPANVPLAGAFTRPEPVIGRVVLYPLSGGEPIVDRQLSNPGAGSGLSVKIPDGMRAISLRTDEVVGVAGFLLPGTHVDVLVTLHATPSAPNTPPDTITTTVLQDVEVLAAGQKIDPDPDGKATTATVVRNGADRQDVDGAPVLLSQLSGGAPLPPPAAEKPRRFPVVVAKTYSVETFLGSKQRMDTF